ncbi:TetR/AcrR family transcriptional regulator [Gordonia sp. NPDC003376]
MSSTEQRISDAAARLFVEKGPTGVTFSELAVAANVARGTLYRNVGSIEDLFQKVVGSLSDDLHERVANSFVGIEDPAARLATGMRLWIRYAHENPTLGRFAVKFGLNEEVLRSWMAGPAKADLEDGISTERYQVSDLDVDSVVSLILGTTISAMWMVLEGHQTWRDAGAEAAELTLRALGIDPPQARTIARADLPRLQH